MKILGIETSCDETAAAVIKDGKEILSNVVASSVDMHSQTGGIIPENAAREQIKAIIPVIDESLKRANTSRKDIDAIAVTIGPGLIGSLLVGVETAKTLSWAWNKPLVPVNHLWGHLYANWLVDIPPKLPAIGLVISGGHTDLVLVEDHGEATWIGGTRDDAAGEAFDKTARLLNLPFPGGPSISKAAAKHEGQSLVSLPRPLLAEANFDFSFSGLKTAVLRETNKFKETDTLSETAIQALAHEIQEAISEVVIQKTLNAARHHNTSTLVVAGGVAANERLRQKFENEIQNQQLNLNLHIPPPRLCTDNATFIAACAYYNFKPIAWQEVDANPSLGLI